MIATCLSLVCPVGYNPASAAAAMRCNIDAFAELALRDQAGEPLIGARIEAIPEDVRGRARLDRIAELVLECLDPDLARTVPWNRAALLVCHREPERPGPRWDGPALPLSLPDGRSVSPARVGHVRMGPVSAVAALQAARDAIRGGIAPACLILAVDSMIDARALAWLDRHERLKTSLVTDGVIPGEAGALLLLSETRLAPNGLRVTGLGRAVEEATVLDDEPFLGLGLAAALRTALAEAGARMHEVDWRLSDAAGESYAFEEVVLAQTRLMREVRESQPLWLPAGCAGDTGAASGLVQLAWAEKAWARGYAPGARAALHLSSAFGGRGAAVVERAP